MNQINCEHPSIILHPLANERILEHRNYTLRGIFNKVIRPDKSQLFKKSFVRGISPKKLDIKIDELDDCFITDSCTGENYPLYLAVPCGSCELCKHSKQMSFVQRCKLETQLYNNQPIFITLTYDEEHKPKDGVSVRDVQLFFKRFRQTLVRYGYSRKIRYVCVSEYGTRTKRPHYHAILWNCGQDDTLSYVRVGELLKQSWSKGFIMHRLVDPSNDNAFFYTSKYLCKDCEIPQGCAKTFLLSSNRGGGIGCPFIRLLQREIVKRLDISPRYLNKFNHKVEKLTLDRYVLGKILPTFSSSLPVGLKNHVRKFMFSYAQLKIRKNENVNLFDEKFEKVFSYFSPYFYCPRFENSDISASLEVSTETLLRDLLEADEAIERAMSRGTDYYESVKYIDGRRQLYLTKLFEHSEPILIDSRAYKFRRERERLKQLEVL